MSKTEAAKYSLNYFNKQGKAELIKLIFAVSNVKFEDKYIENLTDSDTQFGEMPFLQVENTRIPLISVISRFLAREFHLAGESNIEQAKCDSIATNIMMFIDRYYNDVYNVEDTDQKKLGFKSFIENDVENVARECENLIKHFRTNSNDKFSIGNQLTYADLFLYEMAANYLPKEEAFFSRFPLIYSVKTAVEEDNRVSTFLKTLPKRPDYLNIY